MKIGSKILSLQRDDNENLNIKNIFNMKNNNFTFFIKMNNYYFIFKIYYLFKSVNLS